jgi:glycosyltransferase involved in cell wall biosynthesis
MAHAKPVIATAVDGVPEAIDHGRTGLLIPHEDVAALAGAVRQLLDDESLRTAMGAAGRTAVAERFSLEAFAANLRSLYTEALGRRAPPA